ncbi:glycosyltransferase family 1 protein [Bacillus sp. NEB1478]|uniref:glycosyltransferase family 4 protein n=1 Tax=Bacillus sp. NEB1478 TaxID=3073816 RepID=UPI002872E6BE|nr:glycosyltransferase family 1 protein [Bacillus sp. NEB1478]WNB91062.1 glycosyltransferase family 1 protein [Bacillus sp. NEB1478]
MKIGVDLLNLLHDRFGGVEHYVKHILEDILRADEKITFYLFLTRPHRDLFPEFQTRMKKMMIKQSRVQSSLINMINSCQLDLWFSPLHMSALPNISLPRVVTIHDVLHTSYPQFVSGRIEAIHHYYEQSAALFDGVLTVSEFSKKAITEHLPIPEKKINSIYLDAPHDFRLINKEWSKLIVKKKYNLQENYMIYPASFNPHKNHLNLLKAIALLRDDYKKNVQLVLTGFTSKENNTYQSALQFIKNNDLDNQVRVLGFVPPEDMPHLYTASSCMVFPSLYEGFGIPLVEAMKTDCPIVCSDRASTPEITGGAALMFNPEDPRDIALKIVKLLNTNIRKNLIEKGRIRAKAFSWERSAKEALKVFQNVITEHSIRRGTR